MAKRTQAEVGKRYCKAKTRAGTRCQTPPLHAEQYCLWHSSQYSVAKAARGGRACSSDGDLADVAIPKNASEVRDLLALQMIELRQGKISARTATAVVYHATAYLKSTEMVDIQVRLAALEKHQAGEAR